MIPFSVHGGNTAIFFTMSGTKSPPPPPPNLPIIIDLHDCILQSDPTMELLPESAEGQAVGE